MAQVELGPRPAGSEASQQLAETLRGLLPRGRFQAVPGGLRNVVGTVPGREPGYIVVGAHYDTKEIPGFVGANDGASGTAVVTRAGTHDQAAEAHDPLRALRRRGGAGARATTTSPRAGCAARAWRRGAIATHARWCCSTSWATSACGSRARRTRDRGSGGACAASAQEVGAGRNFPDATAPGVQDDHIPFLRVGVPAIDLIDFDFDCYHRTCDDLSAVSQRSLDAVGESVRHLLASL